MEKLLVEIEDYADKIVALAVAVTVFIVWRSSDVGINLWIVQGTSASLVVVTYIVALLGIVSQPRNVSFHKAAAGLGVVFWAGRLAGFLNLVVGDTRWDLLGAVFERGLIVIFLLTAWHLRSLNNIARGL